MCRFALYEPVQFIKLFLADKLEFSKVRQHIAVQERSEYRVSWRALTRSGLLCC